MEGTGRRSEEEEEEEEEVSRKMILKKTGIEDEGREGWREGRRGKETHLGSGKTGSSLLTNSPT